MIFRAQADIPADTELKFGYISCLENYEGRKKMVKKWGFQCECQVCLAEKDVSRKKLKKRAKIIEEMIEHFKKKTATDLGVYEYCSSTAIQSCTDNHTGTQASLTPSTPPMSTHQPSSRAKRSSVQELTSSLPATLMS